MIDEADHLLASFVSEREQELLGRMEEEWEREHSYPWKTKPQSLVEQAERDLFAVVATVARKRIPKKLDDRKTVFALLRATLESNPSSLRRIINEVLRLDPDEQAQLNELLDRTSLSNIIKLANEIGHRLDVVRVLHEVLYGTLAHESNERDHLHPLVADNAWLFGDEWNLCASEISLRTLLTKHLHKLGTSCTLIARNARSVRHAASIRLDDLIPVQ